MLEAAAQVFVFFIAGFETTSTTLTYCLHELARHPEVQETLQEEIDQIMDTPEGFNYENVMNMKYLDMVFNGKICHLCIRSVITVEENIQCYTILSCIELCIEIRHSDIIILFIFRGFTKASRCSLHKSTMYKRLHHS